MILKGAPYYCFSFFPVANTREYWRGKYHCTVDLLFAWFGIRCMTTGNFCFYLQNRLIQTSQTGGQQYSDTSPFSIPCSSLLIWILKCKLHKNKFDITGPSCEQIRSKFIIFCFKIFFERKKTRFFVRWSSLKISNN